MQIGFAANPLKEGAFAVRDRLMQLAGARGLGCVSVEEAGMLLSLDAAPDALVVVGGDGSLLRYADAASARKIPLLGVNLGRVGFLSEVTQEAFETALTRLLDGDYTIERRMMLRCTINDEPPLHCLNDVLVFKRSFSGTAEIGIAIDGAQVGNVFCDGAIAATPTGSTAYSLSAGGPILADGLDAIAVTTVCPHTLYIRPIVTAADAQIRFSVAGSGVVSIDGARICEVQSGDAICVTGAERRCLFIRFGHNDLYSLIRKKLS